MELYILNCSVNLTAIKQLKKGSVINHKVVDCRIIVTGMFEGEKLSGNKD